MVLVLESGAGAGAGGGAGGGLGGGRRGETRERRHRCRAEYLHHEGCLCAEAKPGRNAIIPPD